MEGREGRGEREWATARLRDIGTKRSRKVGTKAESSSGRKKPSGQVGERKTDKKTYFGRGNRKGETGTEKESNGTETLTQCPHQSMSHMTQQSTEYRLMLQLRLQQMKVRSIFYKMVAEKSGLIRGIHCSCASFYNQLWILIPSEILYDPGGHWSVHEVAPTK